MYLAAIVIGTCAVLCTCSPIDLDNPNTAASAEVTVSADGKEDLALTPHSETDTRQYLGGSNYPFRPGSRPNMRCPLCDSSVYPYCGEKLLHDACCCTDPYIHDLPYQCKLADCRFLHANSCREHRLIANCCCSDDYRSLLSSFMKM